LKYSSTFSSIQLKRGTPDRWLAKNPILLAGEVGLEVIENTPLPTTYKIKIGDGLNTWGNLPYYAGIDWTEAQVASTLSLISGNGVSLSQSNPPLMVGSSSNQNLAFDGNEIQSRNNGLASTLFLQSYGGNTSLGASNTSNDSNLIVNGSLTMTNGSTLNATISSSGRMSLPRQPRFQAFGAAGSSSISGNNWIFPSTYSNVGGHYSTTTGRFTAPVSGSYMFFWSNIGNTANDVYRYRIRKNGANVDDVHLRLPEGYTGYRSNGVMMIIIDLAVNDYINIFFQTDSGNSSHASGQYPWFGGYLFG
jgi:hypothetical protein